MYANAPPVVAAHAASARTSIAATDFISVKFLQRPTELEFCLATSAGTTTLNNATAPRQRNTLLSLHTLSYENSLLRIVSTTWSGTKNDPNARSSFFFPPW